MRNAYCLRVAALASLITCVAVTASADYKAAVLALNPTHYWQLDETVLNESTPSVANTGTPGGIIGQHAGIFGMPGEGLGEVGVAGPTGPGGAALPGFDSSNRAFAANNFASIDLGPGSALADNVMTVAGWWRSGVGFPGGSDGGDRLFTNNQNAATGHQFQIFFGAGTGSGAANIGIGLNSAINGFPASGLPSGNTVGNFHIPETTVLVKDGEWHHIVASRNGDAIENVIIVIDGVNYDITTWRDSTDTWGTTGSNAHLGTRTPGDGGSSQHAMNGPIDEMAVWLGRQLTVAESIALYQAAVGGGGPTPGDANGDGSVDLLDLDILGANFGASPATLSQGDFNDDNVVDLLDLDILGANFDSATSTAVPEPTAAALALLAAGLFSARRRS